jgi:outer membrane immunogenic protein
MLRDKLGAMLAAVILAVGYCHDARADGLPKGGLLPIGEVAKAGTTSWSGFYVGAHGGHGWSTWNGDFFWQDVDLGYGYKLESEGWLGGLQVGANYQFGKMVFGLEADISWSDLKKSGQFQANDADPSSYVEWEIKQTLDRFGTVRARIGYTPTEKFMIYGTGGFAWGETSASQTIHYPAVKEPFVNGVGSVSEIHLGWAAGGGVEWLILPNVTLRAEYLYVNLGKQDYHFVGNSGKNLNTFYADDSAPSDLDFHVVRGGLNFKF